MVDFGTSWYCGSVLNCSTVSNILSSAPFVSLVLLMAIYVMVDFGTSWYCGSVLSCSTVSNILSSAPFASLGFPMAKCVMVDFGTSWYCGSMLSCSTVSNILSSAPFVSLGFPMAKYVMVDFGTSWYAPSFIRVSKFCPWYKVSDTILSGTFGAKIFVFWTRSCKSTFAIAPCWCSEIVASLRKAIFSKRSIRVLRALL